MAQFDITNPIAAYSIHFFPPDANVPVFISVYKTGIATAEDVAGYLMFTDHSMVGDYRDWLSSENQYIVKHFRVAQFGDVQNLLQHRIDILRQMLSIHYVGEQIVGGWTTLDAGTSPGLDSVLKPMVTPVRTSVTPPANSKGAPRRKTRTKKK
jgi:hypothetical protein